MANGANYIGQQIGNYRIERELASGGFGTVYLAKHIHLQNRIVAIKLLHAHLASQKERDQFLKEAQLLEKLKHPHILPLLDVGLYNNVPYLVSEYAPQGSLRNRLNRGPKPLSMQEMLSILSQIGQALQFAHDQNVIHRDIKPENILFNARGEALLADFGIATTLTTKSVQRATVVGTFDYMAPEQFQGTVSKESDQYALGCLTYELVTGQLPFNTADLAVIIAMHLNQTPTNPTQLNPQLPAHIAQAILKALAKQRTDRHANVTAFIAALQATGNPPPVQPQNPVPNVVPPMPVPAPVQGLPPTVPANPYPFTWFQKTKDEWLREGHTHYNARRYEEALFAYEQAIILEPNDAVSHLYRGNALAGLLRHEDALASYEQATTLNFNLVWAHLGAGNALKALERYSESLDSYDEALRLNPNLVQAHIGRGDIDYLYYGDLEGALEAYEQAIKLDPNVAQAHNSKGVVLLASERYTEALAAFQHAIKLNPYLAEAYHNIGETLSKLGLTRQAQEAFARAKQLGYKGQ